MKKIIASVPARFIAVLPHHKPFSKDYFQWYRFKFLPADFFTTPLYDSTSYQGDRIYAFLSDLSHLDPPDLLALFPSKIEMTPKETVAFLSHLFKQGALEAAGSFLKIVSILDPGQFKLWFKPDHSLSPSSFSLVSFLYTSIFEVSNIRTPESKMTAMHQVLSYMPREILTTSTLKEVYLKLQSIHAVFGAEIVDAQLKAFNAILAQHGFTPISFPTFSPPKPVVPELVLLKGDIFSTPRFGSDTDLNSKAKPLCTSRIKFSDLPSSDWIPGVGEGKRAKVTVLPPSTEGSPKNFNEGDFMDDIGFPSSP